jgi:hypothetical protein
MPADLQRLHQLLLDSKTVRAILDEMRLAVEALLLAPYVPLIITRELDGLVVGRHGDCATLAL